MNKTAFFLAVLSFACSAEPNVQDLGYRDVASVLKVLIAKDGTTTTDILQTIQITNPGAASKFSNYGIAIGEVGAVFNLVRAEVKNGDDVSSVDREDVHQSTNTQGGQALSTITQYVIPLKKVHVNSEITIEYEIKRKPLVAGMFDFVGGISNEHFAATEKQIFESAVPIKYFTRGFDKFYSATTSRKGTRYVLEIGPTEQARMTEGKELHRGVYAVSTAASWEQLNKNLTLPYEKALKAPLPRAFEKAVTKASALKDPGAQIVSVGADLHDILTYSGDWTTVHGRFFPSGHKAVVKTARGDCKDFATSMVGMLRKLGFEAHVALTTIAVKVIDMSDTTGFKDVPVLSLFNHAIVWTKDNTGTIRWIDPTADPVTAETISPMLLGNVAFVLDGSKTGLQTLPGKNRIPGKLKITQTITLNSDDFVSVTAKLSANETANNPFAMIQKQAGDEPLKRIFGRILNPTIEKEANFHKVMNGSDAIYEITYEGKGWIHESPKKWKSLFVNPAASLLFNKDKTDGSMNFGEEGVVDVDTEIVAQSVVDPILHECTIRSRWLDFDRAISKSGNDAHISDHTVVKVMKISKTDQTTDDFEHLSEEVIHCAKAGNLTIFLDPGQKTSGQTKAEKKTGPPADKMTAADADALENETNVGLRNYILSKLYHYYSMQITKSSQDPILYARRASILNRMAFRDGQKYWPGLCEEGMLDIGKAEELTKGEFKLEVSAAKTHLLFALGKFNDANVEFKRVLDKSPSAFETYYLGYLLSLHAKNYAGAQGYLAYATRVAKSKPELALTRSEAPYLLTEQNKLPEAIKSFDELIKQPDPTPWDLLNAGRARFLNKNYGQAISLEKRGIAIYELDAAKKLLSDALYQSALEIAAKASKTTESDDANQMFRESLKWNEFNIDSLKALAKSNYEKYKADKKSEHNLTEAKGYLDKIMSRYPDDKEAVSLYRQLTQDEKSPGPKSRSVSSSEPAP
jgi:tetratricopeptide (TPR) repeat protein